MKINTKLIMLTDIGLVLTALVFPAGWLSDRIGRKRLNLAAGGLVALGILLLAFAFYAFRTSLGGRPIFGTPRLDD